MRLSRSKSGRTTLVLSAAFVMLAALTVSAPPTVASDDSYSGSDMWLHYVPVSDPDLLRKYRDSVTTVVVDNADQNKVYRHTADLSMEPGSTEKLVDTSLDAARDELVRGLGGLLDEVVPVQTIPG